jgi:hypothetical protein
MITLDGTRGITSPGDYQNSTFTGTYTDGVVVDYTSGQGRISVGSGDVLSFFNGGVATTELMRLDASGNLGIGTSSPSAKLTVQNGTMTQQISTAPASSGTVIGAVTFNSDNSYGTFINAAAINAISLSNWGVSRESGLTFSTLANSVYAEKMRLDNNGNLLVGTTSQVFSGKFCVAANTASAQGIVINNTGGGNGTAINFATSGSTVGNISTTGSATAYNTSSDYRLKENVQPMTGALATVAQLNPVTYDWIADKSKGQGFIAHELQAVVPDCVTGAKDAVDAEGKPVYQGVDTSFLVATLTAAINELKAITDTQAATITALEAKLKAANITGF